MKAIPTNYRFYKNMEKNCPISGRTNTRKILSRLWLSWFFRSPISNNQLRKRSTNSNFWVQTSSGRVGVFHVKGWSPRSSAYPAKPRETHTHTHTLFGRISLDFGWDVPTNAQGPTPFGPIQKRDSGWDFAVFEILPFSPWGSSFQGVLKGTELRWQREPKTQIFAENRRFSQIHPFSWKFKHLEGAGFRRKPKVFAENRRRPQIGLRYLRCVTFSSALVFAISYRCQKTCVSSIQILAHRNRVDFCDLRLRCPSRTPRNRAISETRESNAALRFKSAMESR